MFELHVLTVFFCRTRDEVCSNLPSSRLMQLASLHFNSDELALTHSRKLGQCCLLFPPTTSSEEKKKKEEQQHRNGRCTHDACRWFVYTFMYIMPIKMVLCFVTKQFIRGFGLGLCQLNPISYMYM